MTSTAAEEESLFCEAMQCTTPAARKAWLEAACGADAPLRRRIEALIEAAEEAVDFLEPGVAAAEPIGEKEGDRVGGYRLLERIGEGGCGLVWMAEQEQPVRRVVALKILKPGMDTRAVVARFEAERQALAMMDHPHIARIFEAGATETGRPYFAMELVRGVPITAYCDAVRLGTAGRLELFRQVCEAVQHAHGRGIVHRDLKPSNVLITVNDGIAVPRIIDFGIAKSLGSRLTDKSLFTRFHAFIGTPAYTSPEQAEMSSVEMDARSDVYRLGVLLYELLTGRTPFGEEQLWSAGIDEMRRIIRDDLPARPSRRVSTLGAQEVTELSLRRGIGVTALAGSLRGDLDWIVMKCLEKDRSRRYQTTRALGDDVARHLAHQPVAARAPGVGYRMGKFIRRHCQAVFAVGGVGVALAGGLGVSLWQMGRARREERLARTAMTDLQGTVPVFAGRARDLATQGQFAAADALLDSALKLQPESVELVLAKGHLRESDMQFREAAGFYREVLRRQPDHGAARVHLALCRRLEGPRSREWMGALADLAMTMVDEQRVEGERSKVCAVLADEGRLRLEAVPALAGAPRLLRVDTHPAGVLSVQVAGTSFSDLRVLEDLPVTTLDLSYSGVADLAPLAGMPLRSLALGGCGVADFSPLRSLPRLTSLALQDTAFADTTVLRGLPLTWLNLARTKVTEVAGLRGLPLHVLRITGCRVSDLSPLAGSSVEELEISGTPVRDFSPLAGMSHLTHLAASGTGLSSLEILRSLPLKTLVVDRTSVRDLSPVADIPLFYLLFHDTGVTDLSPLLKCPTLEHLTMPEGAADVERLRSLPRLRRLSFKCGPDRLPSLSVTQFWKEWDERPGRESWKE